MWLSDCKVPTSCGCKTNANCPSTIITFDSLYEVFVLICIWYVLILGFDLTWCCALWQNTTTLVLTVLMSLFQESCLLWSNILNLSHVGMFLLERRGFLLVVLPNKPYSFSLFLTGLSWLLTFNMITEACRVRDVSQVSCNLSEHCTVGPWSEFVGMSTPGKTGHSHKCFPLVNNISHSRMTDSFFGNGCNPPQTDGQGQLLL